MICIVVMGVSGFVGCVVCWLVLIIGYMVIVLVCCFGRCIDGVCEWVYDELDFVEFVDVWLVGFEVDSVIYLVVCVYVMCDEFFDFDVVFEVINVIGMLCVVEVVCVYGVCWFVFVSSIKVVGEGDCGVLFVEDVVFEFWDFYGCLKLYVEWVFV